MNRSQLGNVSAFDFYLATFKGAAGSEAVDDAPDGNAVWTYELAFKPVIDSVLGRFTPAQPRAGKAFTVGAALQLEDGKTVAPTSIRCTAKLAGKTLRGTGPGGCRFAIPKNAKGKRLAVTVRATYADADPVTATTTLKVR